jgi:hypothetical protein
MHVHNHCTFLWYDLPLSYILFVKGEQTATNESEEIEKLSTVDLSKFFSKFTKLPEHLSS